MDKPLTSLRASLEIEISEAAIDIQIDFDPDLDVDFVDLSFASNFK